MLLSRIPIDPDDFQRGRCYVAAAILGAGALGAGASIFGANRASSAQTALGREGLAQQRQMFGVAQNALSPFIDAGKSGLDRLSGFLDPNADASPLNALMKLIMPGANQSATLAQTPGFQFAEDRGLRATNNALAARGLAGSGGAVAKGAAEYTTGLASNTWSSVVNALQNLLTSGSGALQSFVNTGANAAGNLAGGAIKSGDSQAGTLTGIGNAQGGAATAIGNAVGQGANSLSMAALIRQLTGGAGTTPPPGGLYANTATGGFADSSGTSIFGPGY